MNKKSFKEYMEMTKEKLLKEKEKFIVYRNKYYDKHGILGAPKFPDNLEYALTNRGIK